MEGNVGKMIGGKIIFGKGLAAVRNFDQRINKIYE